jgi:hypothetical protein
MTFFDAFYHCMMTSTTIGLGEIAPKSQAGRMYGIVHMVMSVILFGSILSTILAALDRRVAVCARDATYTHRLFPSPRPWRLERLVSLAQLSRGLRWPFSR